MVLICKYYFLYSSCYDFDIPCDSEPGSKSAESESGPLIKT
jgi:hypothetical protein